MKPRASTSPKPWIVGPAVDLLVGCGAWSLPLLALTFWLTGRAGPYLAFAFYFLGVFCNQPHYMATIYRAYRTPESFNKYRFFTLYVTVLVLLTVLIAHGAPAVFPWLFTAYLTWSPWHYSGQNYGIAMLLARRAGAQPSAEDRNLLWWAYLASYAAWFLGLHNAGTPAEPTLVVLPIPETIARGGQLFCLILYLSAGAVAHARLAKQVGWRALAGPIVMFLTQFLWFLLPAVLRETRGLQLPGTYSSAGALAFMHCAQYLWITAYYTRREVEADPDAPRFSLPKYYFALIVGGIALFIPGPWLASRIFGHDLTESFFIFAALVNLHHFMLDGAIWKLRDGRIARLLLGRNPPAGADELEAAEHAASPLRWLTGPTAGARALRYGGAAVLLGLALVDQAQYWLTLKGTSEPALAFAHLLNPQDTRVYVQRARRELDAGRTTDAMADLRHAIAINPRNASAQHQLGELLIRAGDPAAALQHYDRMAELFPPDVVVLTNRGVLLLQRGEATKARESFEAALHLAPQNTPLHLYLAEARETVGDVSGAISEYERFAELHANDAESPEFAASCVAAALKLGDLHRGQSRRDRAIEWYRRAAILASRTRQASALATAQANLAALGAKP